jgi:hypothetical protein
MPVADPSKTKILPFADKGLTTSPLAAPLALDLCQWFSAQPE